MPVLRNLDTLIDRNWDTVACKHLVLVSEQSLVQNVSSEMVRNRDTPAGRQSQNWILLRCEWTRFVMFHEDAVTRICSKKKKQNRKWLKSRMEVCMQSPNTVPATSRQDRRGQSERSGSPGLVHSFGKQPARLCPKFEVRQKFTD